MSRILIGRGDSGGGRLAFPPQRVRFGRDVRNVYGAEEFASRDEMRNTVVRGPMGPGELAFAQELALARQAGMIVEQPAVLGDARKQHYGIGDVTVPALGFFTVPIIAGFTFKLLGFFAPSTLSAGLLLQDVQIARKSQMLSSGGVALEAYSEVSLIELIGDTANQGQSIEVTLRNTTAGAITLYGAALVCAVPR